MKKIMMAAVALCCMTMISVTTTSCADKGNRSPAPDGGTDSLEVVMNLDSVVITPYLYFGTSLDDVQAYMAKNYADYSDATPDSLEYIDLDGGGLWVKCYKNGKRDMSFFFKNADGNDFVMVSYDFYFPIQIEAVMGELERNGFTNKGVIRFENDNSDLSYLFLSPDESIEAMVFYWEKDGGSWAVSFQSTNDFDLQHLVEE